MNWQDISLPPVGQNLPVSKHSLYVRCRGLTISMSHNFIMLIDVSSQPLAFLGSNERIMLKIFSPVISTLESEELHLETGISKTLSLEINEHCSTK